MVGYSNSNVEVVSHNLLKFGYGPDDGGGDTTGNLVYLTKRFGPISSFSGSYQANRWTVNITQSPGNIINVNLQYKVNNSSYLQHALQRTTISCVSKTLL